MTKLTARTALVEMNLRWLSQALDLLELIEERHFRTPPKGFGTCRVSSQLRHVIEFYECFLDGLESVHIDYDARRRDGSLEASCRNAAERIQTLMERLVSEPALEFDNVLFVRMEDSDSTGLEDPFLMSSVSRELMALSSHTIHHFALIAMTLKAHGVHVDPEFGVAPSTLRYRENTGRALAAEAA
jgi:hypothetical protein